MKIMSNLILFKSLWGRCLYFRDALLGFFEQARQIRRGLFRRKRRPIGKFIHVQIIAYYYGTCQRSFRLRDCGGNGIISLTGRAATALRQGKGAKHENTTGGNTFSGMRFGMFRGEGSASENRRSDDCASRMEAEVHRGLQGQQAERQNLDAHRAWDFRLEQEHVRKA